MEVEIRQRLFAETRDASTASATVSSRCATAAHCSARHRSPRRPGSPPRPGTRTSPATAASTRLWPFSTAASADRCAGSRGLFLPDQPPVAIAGQACRDGAVTIDLAVNSGASCRSHGQYALRTYGPCEAIAYPCDAIEIFNVGGGPTIGQNRVAPLAPNVSSSVRDTPKYVQSNFVVVVAGACAAVGIASVHAARPEVVVSLQSSAAPAGTADEGHLPFFCQTT